MLTREILRGERALFVGSGCSVDPPSCIPASADLARAFAAGMGGSLTDSEWCRNEFGRTDPSLEDVAERIAAHKRGSIYQDHLIEWRYRRPNLNHRIMAQMLAESYVKVLVTTNYDDLIERYLREELETRINEAIIEEADCGHRSDDKPTIVKLHGCITKFNSVKIARRDFQDWETEWAKGYVTSVVRNYSLLLLAYSGSDPHIMETLNSMIGATKQGSTWVVRTRSDRIDAFLGSHNMNPDEQVTCDVKDFLLELRSNCFNATFHQVLEERTRATLEYYVQEGRSSEVLAEFDTVASGLSQSLDASEYFKIFMGDHERAYRPLRKYPDKLSTLLLWTSILRYAIDRVKPTGWSVHAYSNGFHLEVIDEKGKHRLGFFLLDSLGRSVKSVLGQLNSWFIASGATEVVRYPRVNLRAENLVRPSQVFVAFIDNGEVPPLESEFILSTPFFGDSPTAVAKCIGTTESVDTIKSNLDGFVDRMRQWVFPA